MVARLIYVLGCRLGRFLFLTTFLFLLWAGCKKTPLLPPPEPPTVTVESPIVRDQTLYETFHATLEPIQSVEIRARVQGFLEEIRFKPGVMVEMGELLFVIEPKPYEAKLAEAQANLDEAETALKLAELNLARSEKLVRTKTVTVEEYQTKLAQRETASARVLQNRSLVDQARIRYSYTHIHAPMAGRIGRWLVDRGNLVGVGEDTLLTSIVQMDPLYAYFEVNEKSLLKYLRWRKKYVGESKQRNLTIYLKVPGEDRWHEGQWNYVDTQVDPETGTLLVRGLFPNQDETLFPGIYVRVLVPYETLENAVLVRDRAIGTDLGGKFLMVVTEHDVVQIRYITLGQTVDGGLRMVTKGIKPNERYVVKGLQHARPGEKVKVLEAPPEPPEKTPLMPTVETEAPQWEPPDEQDRPTAQPAPTQPALTEPASTETGPAALPTVQQPPSDNRPVEKENR